MEITDNSFPTDNFVHVSGELNARIDRVPPHSNVSHVVVVRPKKYGYFNFTSAEVLYRRKEDAPRLQVAVSSEPGQAYFVSYREFDKKFSSHVVRIILFHTFNITFKNVFLGNNSEYSKYNKVEYNLFYKNKEKSK